MVSVESYTFSPVGNNNPKNMMLVDLLDYELSLNSQMLGGLVHGPYTKLYRRYQGGSFFFKQIDPKTELTDLFISGSQNDFSVFRPMNYQSLVDFFLGLPLSDDFVILPYKNMSMIYGTSPLQWGEKFRRVPWARSRGSTWGRRSFLCWIVYHRAPENTRCPCRERRLDFFLCKRKKGGGMRSRVSLFLVFFVGGKGDMKRHFFQLLSFQKKSTEFLTSKSLSFG